MLNSIAFCNSLFADRSGVAASGFLVVAAVCIILLCFSAKSCKSHCNDGVRVANRALAAKFFDFGNIHFPVKLPFKKLFIHPILKLRFAIFDFWNLKEESHESFVFISST